MRLQRFVTGNSTRDDLRDALLSDRHGQPAIWITDGMITDLNEAAKRLLGIDAAGRAFFEFLDEQSKKKFERLLAAGSAATRTELQIEHGGSPLTLAAFLVLRAGDSGLALIGLSQGISYPETMGQRLLSASADLTASLRQLWREVHDIRAAKEALEKIDDLRNGFLTALAHDMRTPLDAVLLEETLLESEGGDNQQIASHRTVVERNVLLALQLIDSVVSAARIDTENPELNKQKLRLVDIARQWCDALTSVARAAEVTLQLVEHNSAQVDGDAVRLGEVVSNLLSNAIRHSPAGGLVSIEISQRGNEVYCSVADQGDGIPPAVRASIFEKFAQGGSPRGVSGMGLYVARRIVELHGGRIWLDDNVACGSRFVFCMPAAHAGSE